jgi:hypothetical protein
VALQTIELFQLPLIISSGFVNIVWRSCYISVYVNFARTLNERYTYNFVAANSEPIEVPLLGGSGESVPETGALSDARKLAL